MEAYCLVPTLQAFEVDTTERVFTEVVMPPHTTPEPKEQMH
jgi:hypothetical protein